MSTNYYLPEDSVPLPPPHADVLTTCCDYWNRYIVFGFKFSNC